MVSIRKKSQVAMLPEFGAFLIVRMLFPILMVILMASVSKDNLLLQLFRNFTTTLIHDLTDVF